LSDVIEGVTAERLKELRELVFMSAPSLLKTGLRDALRFYDLAHKAWQGCREEYAELRQDDEAILKINEQIIAERDALARELAIVKEQLEATQTELERRTAWCNAQLAELQAEHDELALERDELKAELRKYEPSDGMMHKLLALNTAIVEAARMLELFTQGGPGMRQVTLEQVLGWLDLPAVQIARRHYGGPKEEGRCSK
jgi:hypothetical protein